MLEISAVSNLELYEAYHWGVITILAHLIISWPKKVTNTVETALNIICYIEGNLSILSMALWHIVHINDIHEGVAEMCMLTLLFLFPCPASCSLSITIPAAFVAFLSLLEFSVSLSRIDLNLSLLCWETKILMFSCEVKEEKNPQNVPAKTTWINITTWRWLPDL